MKQNKGAKFTAISESDSPHPSNTPHEKTDAQTQSPQSSKTISCSLRIRQATQQGYIEITPVSVFDASYPDSKSRRGRVQGWGRIAPAITSAGAQNLWVYIGNQPIKT